MSQWVCALPDLTPSRVVTGGAVARSEVVNYEVYVVEVNRLRSAAEDRLDLASVREAVVVVERLVHGAAWPLPAPGHPA